MKVATRPSISVCTCLGGLSPQANGGLPHFQLIGAVKLAFNDSFIYDDQHTHIRACTHIHTHTHTQTNTFSVHTRAPYKSNLRNTGFPSIHFQAVG